MTVNDTKNLLFNFFAENDILDEDIDFNKIVLISENPEVDKGILKLALKDFHDASLIRPVDLNDNNKHLWVLNKPIKQYSQTIELQFDTISALSNIINNFCDEVGDSANKVDILNITEKDIQSLIVIAHSSVDAEE